MIFRDVLTYDRIAEEVHQDSLHAASIRAENRNSRRRAMQIKLRVSDRCRLSDQLLAAVVEKQKEIRSVLLL